MTTDSQVLDELHILLHALRMSPPKTPTQFEVKVSYIISNHFSSKCSECKNVLDIKRREAEERIKGNVVQQNKSPLDKLFGK